MITNYDIADYALGYLLTPYHHQGRAKGVGIDCAGLVLCVGWDSGAWDRSFDVKGYGTTPDPGVYLSIIKGCLVETAEILPGCVLSIVFKKYQQHLAIVTYGGRAMHSLQGTLTHEFTLDDVWMKRVRGVYRYPGVTYG